MAATHPVFVGLALSRLDEAPFSRIVVTDTIPDARRLDPIRDRLTILTVAGLLGDAVHRIHHNQSVSALFRQVDGVKR